MRAKRETKTRARAKMNTLTPRSKEKMRPEAEEKEARFESAKRRCNAEKLKKKFEIEKAKDAKAHPPGKDDDPSFQSPESAPASPAMAECGEKMPPLLPSDTEEEEEEDE